MLVIAPDDCIDCGACVDPCPVHAIYPEDEVPEHLRHYIEMNARLARQWPEITITRVPLPDADVYAEVEEKEHLLDTAPGEGDPDADGFRAGQ